GVTGGGGALGPTPTRAPLGGDPLALEACLSVVAVRHAADDLRSRCRRRAGVGVAGSRRDDHAPLSSAFVGRPVLALHARVVARLGNAADRLLGRRLCAGTRVRDARGAGRDRAAFRGALVGGAIFALHLRLPTLVL